MRLSGLRALVIGLLLLTAGQAVESAQAASEESRLARLTAQQREILLAWEKAVHRHERALDAYWSRVTEKRSERRRKRKAGQRITTEDYIAELAPKYKGPEEPTAILKLLPDKDRKTTKKRPPQPVVADYLAHAAELFGFAPERIPEPEFKRRYARAALDAGLTKDQIIRVYALETGGVGTADMQSGINPITRKGRAISSALGYAQLLDANSVDQISRRGSQYAKRLEAMAEAGGIPHERRESLLHKATVLRSMVRVAKSVPAEWEEHRKLSRTPRGMALHVLNLDADVGPWLQVDKLNDIRIFAAERGMPRLTGAELELMNLAGPGTGLEMMQPAGLDMPTTNFFERGGYYRNPVVHDRTSRELLAKLEERMEVHMQKAGAVEFAAIFDEIIEQRQASD